jgi:uncharacterized membrane protein YcaP (DUF421 family)
MRLGLSWTDAATVVVSTVGIYLAFLVLLRIVGQHAVAAMSSFDFAAAIAFGAVLGRTVLGYTPTLAAGLLGMVTLFVLQAGFGLVRRNRRLDRALNNLPLLFMVNGEVLPDRLRTAKMVEDELHQQMRLAGIHRYDDVAAVILERTGAISVPRRGETIAPELLSDVRGRELLQTNTSNPSGRPHHARSAKMAIEQPAPAQSGPRPSATRGCRKVTGSARGGKLSQIRDVIVEGCRG